MSKRPAQCVHHLPAPTKPIIELPFPRSSLVPYPRPTCQDTEEKNPTHQNSGTAKKKHIWHKKMGGGDRTGCHRYRERRNLKKYWVPVFFGLVSQYPCFPRRKKASKILFFFVLGRGEKREGEIFGWCGESCAALFPLIFAVFLEEEEEGRNSRFFFLLLSSVWPPQSCSISLYVHCSPPGVAGKKNHPFFRKIWHGQCAYGSASNQGI